MRWNVLRMIIGKIKNESKISTDKKEPCSLYAHLSGKIVNLDNVPDEAFSTGILGEGVAIEPDECVLYAPCDGNVVKVFDTKHAVNIVSDEGCEILLHIGIDTVKLSGRFFESHVKDGDRIHKGDRLVTFDAEGIRKAGYKTVTPMVICNSDEYEKINILTDKNVSAGEKIIDVH